MKGRNVEGIIRCRDNERDWGNDDCGVVGKVNRVMYGDFGRWNGNERE